MKELKEQRDQYKIDSANSDKSKEALKSKLDVSEQNAIDLRCIIEGYKCEIETLNSVESEGKSKDEDEDLPSTSKCGQCDYESDSEHEIKEHILINHERICNPCDLSSSSKLSHATHNDDTHIPNSNKFESDVYVTKTDIECKTCGSVFRTEEKLENHLCRVTVRNPTFCNFYTKKWIPVNRCSSIFHRIKKEEVAILHCEDCVTKKNRCGENHPLWFPAQEDHPIP